MLAILLYEEMKVVQRGATYFVIEWEEHYRGATYTLELSRLGNVVLTADTTDLSFTFKDLPPDTEYTIKLSTETEQKFKYETILLQYTGGDEEVFFGIKEVEVYDGDGNYMTPDMFTLTQSSTFSHGGTQYSADRAMNGLYSSWQDGSLPLKSVRPWWKASLNTPSEIDRIVFYTNDTSNDKIKMANATLTLEGETTTTVQPAGINVETIYL